MSDAILNQTMSLDKVEQLMLARYKILLTLDSLAATHTKYTDDYHEELKKRILNTQKNSQNDAKKGQKGSEKASSGDGEGYNMSKIITEAFHLGAIKTQGVQKAI